MTAIAYKDGIMAGDAEVSLGWLKLPPEIKVRKERGHLIGISGMECPTWDDFFEWLFARKRIYDRWGHGYDFHALVVDPKRKVWIYTNLGDKIEITHPFFAVGCGAELSIGAMAKGATAEEAVRFACEWVTNVSGDVSSVALTGRRRGANR